MGYIGSKPSAVPLTSADITDGIITNADIANSTINLTTKVTGSLPVANGGTGLTALGSSLQVLRTNTGATALEFATISTGASAGQVIQVVTATDSTLRSTSSTAYGLNNSTLSVNITPSATANKMFVIITTSMSATNGFWTIFRDSTDLNLAYYGNGDVENPGALSILDSPNTTSQVNYQIRFKSNSGTTNINTGPAKGAITVFEIKG